MLLWGIMIWAPSFCPSEICRSGWISPTPMNICFYTLHMHLLQSSMNPVKFRQDQIKNGGLLAIFVCSNWQNIWKCCPSGYISSTLMNISSWYFTHALTTILPWILWSFVWIKFDMANLFPFLFAQIDKIFENVVRPDEYLQHQ